MSISRFLKELILVILFSLVTIAVINYFLGSYAEWRLSFIGIALFASLSVIINLLGKRSLKSDNKYGFIKLIMANVMFKIIASFAVVGVYFKFYTPGNKFFVLPFLIVYLIFTIFETSSLIRQSDIKK